MCVWLNICQNLPQLSIVEAKIFEFASDEQTLNIPLFKTELKKSGASCGLLTRPSREHPVAAILSE